MLGSSIQIAQLDQLKVAGMTVTNDGTKTTILGLAGDYVRIGTGGVTGHSLASENDLMVTGKLEVKGATYLDGTVDIVGNVGIGVASSAGQLLYVTGTLNADVTGGNLKGINIVTHGQRTSGAEDNIITGIESNLDLTASNTQAWTAALGVRGIDSTITLNTNTYTVTGSTNYRASTTLAINTTLTNRYGLYIVESAGSGTLTNQYGIYIEDLTKGATLDYALYTNAGLVHIGDTIDIANTKAINTGIADNDYFTIGADDTGVGIAEVARAQGAADPYFSMGGSQQQKFTTAGLVGFFAAAPVGQQTGVAAQKVDYATPGLDTEAEIITAFNTTNAAINVLRTALINLGLTTTV